MYYIKVLVSVVLFLLIGCADSSTTTDSSSDTNTETTITSQPVTAEPVATPPTAEPAQNAQGVWHFTCPKGCEGGGGAATPCPKCGTALAHNSAYHGSTPANSGSPDISVNPPPVTKTPEPAQNATGVWHYTCSDGCAGGAGTATACAKCGKTLVHNQIYHQ